jgi:UDP-sulfoquinovose synthase
MIDIRDTLACIELALENPAERGEFRVFNQFTESFSVRELAGKVLEAYPGKVEVMEVENPRVELEEHFYQAEHSKLSDLGLDPHLLSVGTVTSIMAAADRCRERVDLDAILPRVAWRERDVGRREGRGDAFRSHAS